MNGPLELSGDPRNCSYVDCWSDEGCEKHRPLRGHFQRNITLLLVSAVVGGWLMGGAATAIERAIMGWENPVVGSTEVVPDSQMYVPVEVLTKDGLAALLAKQADTSKLVGLIPEDAADPQINSWPSGDIKTTWRIAVKSSGAVEVLGNMEDAKTQFWKNGYSGWSGDHCGRKDGILSPDAIQSMVTTNGWTNTVHEVEHLHKEHVIVAQTGRYMLPTTITTVAVDADGNSFYTTADGSTGTTTTGTIPTQNYFGSLLGDKPDEPVPGSVWAVAITGQNKLKIWGTIPESAKKIWQMIADALPPCK